MATAPCVTASGSSSRSIAATGRPIGSPTTWQPTARNGTTSRPQSRRSCRCWWPDGRLGQTASACSLGLSSDRNRPVRARSPRGREATQGTSAPTPSGASGSDRWRTSSWPANGKPLSPCITAASAVLGRHGVFTSIDGDRRLDAASIASLRCSAQRASREWRRFMPFTVGGDRRMTRGSSSPRRRREPRATAWGCGEDRVGPRESGPACRLTNERQQLGRRAALASGPWSRCASKVVAALRCTGCRRRIDASDRSAGPARRGDCLASKPAAARRTPRASGRKHLGHARLFDLETDVALPDFRRARPLPHAPVRARQRPAGAT